MSRYAPFNPVADYNIKVQQAKTFLGFSPTADVVEVRHGQWISESFISKTGEKLYHTPMCSVCNQRTSFRSKFCPDCGAKMDGERREE